MNSSNLLQFLLVLFLGLGNLPLKAQNANSNPASRLPKNVCSSTPSQTPCTPACGTTCQYRVCSARSDQGSLITSDKSQRLPVEFTLPADSCVNPGGTVTIRSIPDDFSRYPYLDWNSSSLTLPRQITYARCAAVPVVGPACAAPPSSCPFGMTPISSGPNTGKCASACNPTNGDISISDMDGSNMTVIAGGCNATCTPATHCANYVQCVYKNLCNPAAPAYVGPCGSAGSGTLGCGATVTFASCPSVIVGGETTIACAFAAADDPSPLTVGFPATVPSAAACGIPAAACVGASAGPCSSCSAGFTLSGTSCVATPCAPVASSCDASSSSLPVPSAGSYYENTALPISGFCGAPQTAVGTYTTSTGTCTAAELACSKTYRICDSIASGPSCFVGGTQISMADGTTRSIELVKTGDLVMTLDEISGEPLISQVVKTHHHSPKLEKIYDFKMANGRSFQTNNYHPIYVWEKKNYFKVDQIFAMWMIGERLSLQSENGSPVQILSIDTFEKESSMYNFEVAGINKYSPPLGGFGRGHNYYAEGFLVHNALYMSRTITTLLFNWLGQTALAAPIVEDSKQ